MTTSGNQILPVLAVLCLQVVSLTSGQSNGHAQAITNNRKEVCSSVLDDPDGGVKKLRYLLNATHLCCPCNPGERLVALCRPDDYQSTVCEKCGENSFITKYAHEETTCTNDTRRCPADQYIIPSTPTKESRCDCLRGFKIEEGDACRPHTKCKPGSGVAVLGTPHSDTKCVPCQNGYVSPNHSSTEACRVADRVRNHPKNKHLFKTTDESFATNHGNLLYEQNTSVFETFTNIPTNNSGAEKVPTFKTDNAGIQHPWQWNLYQIGSLGFCVSVMFLIGLVLWKCGLKPQWKFCLRAEHDVEKEIPNDILTGNGIEADSQNQRTEKKASIISEVSNANPSLTTDDGALTPKIDENNQEETEETSINNETPSNDSHRVTSGITTRRQTSRISPTPSQTYCRKKQQKKKQHETQSNKRTECETMPTPIESYPLSDFRHPAHPRLTSRDEAIPLLETTRFAKPTSIVNQSYLPAQESTKVSSQSHSTPSLDGLKIALSTRITRDAVKCFYRTLSLDEFKEPVIEDLNRNYLSTSEMFIAAFTKLMDLSPDHFNPQSIQRHFLSQNNCQLADFVKDFFSNGIINAVNMSKNNSFA